MKIAEVKLDGKGRLQIPNVFLKANNIKAFPSRNYEFVYHQVHKRMRELEGIETLEKRICIYQLRRCNVWSLKK